MYDYLHLVLSSHIAIMIKSLSTSYFQVECNIQTNIAALCVGLYQLTRPFNFEKSYYYSLVLKNGRHKTLNKYLKNFLKNFTLN